MLPIDQLLNRTKELVSSYVSGNSFESITRVVDAIVNGYNNDLKMGLEKELELFAELFLTNDAKEGFEAFNEKKLRILNIFNYKRSRSYVTRKS